MNGTDKARAFPDPVVAQQIGGFIAALRRELGPEDEIEELEYPGAEGDHRRCGFGVYADAQIGQMFVVAGGHPYRNPAGGFLPETSRLLSGCFGRGPAILDAPSHPSWVCDITSAVLKPETYAVFEVVDRHGATGLPAVSEAEQQIHDGCLWLRYDTERRTQESCYEKFGAASDALDGLDEARISETAAVNAERASGGPVGDFIADILDETIADILVDVCETAGVCLTDSEQDLGTLTDFTPSLDLEGPRLGRCRTLGLPLKITARAGFATGGDDDHEHFRWQQTGHFVYYDHLFFGDGHPDSNFFSGGGRVNGHDTTQPQKHDNSSKVSQKH